VDTSKPDNEARSKAPGLTPTDRLIRNGPARYELKTPYRDGTTHVIFEPMDFSRSRHPASRDISASVHVIARLVACVSKPRVSLIRFHLP
jgi:hypothetical protein